MKKLLLTIALVGSAVTMYGQGTVQFNNPATVRVVLHRADGVVSNAPPSTAPNFRPLNFAIFAGDSALTVSDTPITPFGAMGTATSGGLFTATGGSAYAVPFGQGATPFLRVRGWSASFGSDWRAAMMAYQSGVAGTIFGETDIRQVEALASPQGPGTVIWQGASGTAPTRFFALQLFEAVPEPSVIALAIIGLGSLVFLRRRK